MDVNRLVSLIAHKHSVDYEQVSKIVEKLLEASDKWLLFHSLIVASWSARLAAHEKCNVRLAFMLGLLHDLHEVLGSRDKVVELVESLGLGGELVKLLKEYWFEDPAEWSCEVRCVSDADILAKAGMLGFMSQVAAVIARNDDPMKVVYELLPKSLSILSNPKVFLTRYARRVAVAYLERTREVYLTLLSELGMHGAPLVPSEQRAYGTIIHYTKIVRCPSCGSASIKTTVLKENELILVKQMCSDCGYSLEVKIPTRKHILTHSGR